MTNRRGDTFPKRNVVVDENFFVPTVIKVALLGIPEVCPDVIGCVASLYVYYLFHDWPLRQPRFAAVHKAGAVQHGCRLESPERKIDEMAAMFGNRFAPSLCPREPLKRAASTGT
jgi:hypothetical protein